MIYIQKQNRSNSCQFTEAIKIIMLNAVNLSLTSCVIQCILTIPKLQTAQVDINNNLSLQRVEAPVEANLKLLSWGVFSRLGVRKSFLDSHMTLRRVFFISKCNYPALPCFSYRYLLSEFIVKTIITIKKIWG